jgi:hypothetical protein
MNFQVARKTKTIFKFEFEIAKLLFLIFPLSLSSPLLLYFQTKVCENIIIGKFVTRLHES